ncbi:Lipopolysaccharide biosynthesis protein, LPS:glycosyltransferase [Methylobacterium sp. 190mf]|uniref:glycosyltransferase family 8 protein n=1 Tax=Methylobacterium sp. 190mf TaxID=1761798 RepID=UPI00089E9A1C|nr:glycosyltransferase [Methylobacterium sp. 190mf]SEG71127.1 Lipopolysaccharide biosynthesis protein, LPS:glycosyltransferase [Methylobacterium sp. 190mf]
MVAVRTGWCYTTDENYLFPTLVSASQVAKQVDPQKNEVLIIYFGGAETPSDSLKDVAAAEGVSILALPKSILNGSPMICARLHIADIVSSRYEFMVYVDGDTQILGGLDDLASTEPRAGSLLAAPDLMSFTVSSPGRKNRIRSEYFRSIGIDTRLQSRYFNSGVIKVSVNDWKTISDECIRLLKNVDINTYSFRDQDALNLVMGGNHDLISIRWNWPAFFWGCGLEKLIVPKILHFMSRPRPWEGAFLPWGETGNGPYRDFVSLHPQLTELYLPFGGLKKARYVAQQHVKNLVANWGNQDLIGKIMTAEANAVI